MIFSFFYNLVLIIAILPRFFFRKRNFLFKRLGFSLPAALKTNKTVIWIHAISLGETKSCQKLISKIRKDFPESVIYLSSVTQTGFEYAQKNKEVDLAFIMPLDFSWNMKRMYRRLTPDVLILVETDFWYHHLKYAKKNKAKILLVSGKISKKSVRNFQRAQFFSRKLFSFFDLVCVQNRTYLKRFARIGLNSKNIFVTGNLKYDQETPFLAEKEKKEWKERLGIFDGESVLTVASTHAPEEKMLIKELKKLWDKEYEIKILLAPRHPERFVSVAQILKAEKISFIELSRLEKKKNTEKVILIDRMGFLPICYQLSEAAIIGGSFIERIGGHNILEPNFYSVPVFFGPYMKTQEDLKKIILAASSGVKMTLESFTPSLEQFLQDQKLKDRMKKNAQDLIFSLKGYVCETYEKILPHLNL